MNQKLTDKELFELLKTSVENTFLQENSTSNSSISLWKGQDIVNFQEDLRLKVKGQVSEKWFYTHIKSDIKKLPRIDMLNLLAKYCGFKGWSDFVEQNQEKPELVKLNQEVEKVENVEWETIPIKNKSKRNKKLWISIGLGFLILLAIATYYYLNSKYYQIHTKGPIYEFCFVNADRNTLVKDLVEITLKADGKAPHTKGTRDGCYSFHSTLDTVQMIVESYNYKIDSFNLILSHYNEPQTIELRPDDYKLVWRYYLNSDVETRREKLKNSIDKNAQIYRIYEDNQSFIEPYTREDYIEYLSYPNTNLENFEIIHSRKKKNKFIYIKFKINEKDEQ